MPDRILTSAEATAGGILTLIGSFFIQIYEWVTFENVNNFLEFGLAVGGAFFLYYRIRLTRSQQKGVELENQLKKKELEEK